MSWIVLAGIISFSAASLVIITSANSENPKLIKWRAGLLLAGLLGSVAVSIWPTSVKGGSIFLILIIALVEEVIGRWLFYARRNPGI